MKSRVTSSAGNGGFRKGYVSHVKGIGTISQAALTAILSNIENDPRFSKDANGNIQLTPELREEVRQVLLSRAA